MLTVATDYAPFTAQLDALYNAFVAKGRESDAQNVLQDQTRLLVRKIAALTPPPGLNSAALKMGENAIKNDLEGLIAEANPELFDSIKAEYGTKNVDAPFTNKKGEEKRLIWENLTDDVGQLPELHNRYRRKWGRARKARQAQGQWRAFVVVPHGGTREAYIKQVQKNVGRWKAKWALVGKKLGDERWPAWIKRHFEYAEKYVTFTADLDNRENPSITFGGRGPDFRREEVRIRDAFRSRIKIISKHIRHILNDYADVQTKGQKIAQRAKRWKEEEPEAA
jgi:hypothetical protein